MKALRCEEVEFFISLRTDGELPTAEAPRLEAHLATCPRCRAIDAGEARRASAVRAALAPAQESEAILRARILVAARERAACEAGRRTPLAIGSRWTLASFPRSRLIAAAALLLVLLGGWKFIQERPGPGGDGNLNRALAGDTPVIFIEQRSQDEDLLSPEAGEPVQRDTIHTHWDIVPTPVGWPAGKAAPRVRVEFDRTDTNFSSNSPYLRFSDYR